MKANMPLSSINNQRRYPYWMAYKKLVKEEFNYVFPKVNSWEFKKNIGKYLPKNWQRTSFKFQALYSYFNLLTLTIHQCAQDAKKNGRKTSCIR